MAGGRRSDMTLAEAIGCFRMIRISSVHVFLAKSHIVPC